MAVSEHDFLEEILGLRREACWDDTTPNLPIPNEENHFFFPNAYNGLDYFDPTSFAFLPNSFSDQQVPQSYNNSSFNEIYNSLLDEFSTPQFIDSSPPYATVDTNSSSLSTTPPLVVQEENNYDPLLSSIMNMEEEGLFEPSKTRRR